MGGMVADAGEALDDERDPLQGPSVAVEPVGQGALAEGSFDLAALAAVQSGFAACPPGGAEGGAAALVPAALPAVGVLAGGAQPVGDLGLAGALLEQAGGAQSEAFHLVEVTAVAGRWVRCSWPLFSQFELLGRIMASEHIALFSKAP